MAEYGDDLTATVVGTLEVLGLFRDTHRLTTRMANQSPRGLTPRPTCFAPTDTTIDPLRARGRVMRRDKPKLARAMLNRARVPGSGTVAAQVPLMPLLSLATEAKDARTQAPRASQENGQRDWPCVHNPGVGRNAGPGLYDYWHRVTNA